MSEPVDLDLFVQVLCKMGIFFNEITQLCLSQTQQKIEGNLAQKIEINRATFTQFQQARLRFTFGNSLHEQQSDAQNFFVPKSETKKKLKDLKLIKSIKNHKPKHPVSSFFFFFQDRSREIAKQHNEVVGSKIACLVAQTWKNMNEQQREPYEARSREARQEYELKMIDYRRDFADQIAELKQLKRRERSLLKEQTLIQVAKKQLIPKQTLIPLIAQINQLKKKNPQFAIDPNNSPAGKFIELILSSSSDDSTSSIESDGLSDSLSSKNSNLQIDENNIIFKEIKEIERKQEESLFQNKPDLEESDQI